MPLSPCSECLSCPCGLEVLLPHLAGVVIERVELAGERAAGLGARAHGRADAAACPACGDRSGRVHSCWPAATARMPVLVP